MPRANKRLFQERINSKSGNQFHTTEIAMLSNLEILDGDSK